MMSGAQADASGPTICVALSVSTQKERLHSIVAGTLVVQPRLVISAALTGAWRNVTRKKICVFSDGWTLELWPGLLRSSPVASAAAGHASSAK